MLSVDKDRGVVEVFCPASLNLQVRVAEELDRINAGIAIDMSRRVALAESDIFDIDGNQRKARDLLLRGIVGKDPPCGRHHNPAKITVIMCVVDALSASENVYGVLMPPQQAVLSEV